MINLKKRQRNDRYSASETFYIIDCLLAKQTGSPAEVLPVRLDCVCGISAVRLMVPSDLRSADARNNLYAAIGKVRAKLGGGELPQLDPIKDMHIKDAKFKEINQVRSSSSSSYPVLSVIGI